MTRYALVPENWYINDGGERDSNPGKAPVRSVAYCDLTSSCPPSPPRNPVFATRIPTKIYRIACDMGQPFAESLPARATWTRTSSSSIAFVATR